MNYLTVFDTFVRYREFQSAVAQLEWAMYRTRTDQQAEYLDNLRRKVTECQGLLPMDLYLFLSPGLSIREIVRKYIDQEWQRFLDRDYEVTEIEEDYINVGTADLFFPDGNVPVEGPEPNEEIGGS